MALQELSSIELANERYSIIQACNKLGMDIPDFSFSSAKLYCPFGHLFHADGGQSKAFRVYPGTNSAFCFAGCGYYSPVRLIATDKGISEADAAESILEETNYVPPDFESRWNALMTEQATPNPDDLAEALKVACARMEPNWDERQFEEKVSIKLRQCLQLLPKVQTEEDATKWLSMTKQAMHITLGEYSGRED